MASDCIGIVEITNDIGIYKNNITLPLAICHNF